MPGSPAASAALRALARELDRPRARLVISPQAAQEVVEALQNADLPVSTDPRRGLDHGAWVQLAWRPVPGPCTGASAIT